MVSQSRTVVSKEADANSRPLGEKVTEEIKSEWARRVCCKVPVNVSQSRIVLSKEPDASTWQSGEKATVVTPSEWP